MAMPAGHHVGPTPATLQSTRVLAARVDFASQPFVEPLVLSSGAIVAITLATAQVRVSVGGCEAAGHGAIYLSDLWSWPNPMLSHEQRDVAMRRYCEELAADLPRICGEQAHPLSLGLRLHDTAIPRTTPPHWRVRCAAAFSTRPFTTRSVRH